MKKSFKGLEYVPPHDPDVQSYLHLMQQGAGFDSLNKQTYLPVVGLPRREQDSQSILDRIYELGGDIGGKDAFRYLVGELTDNIYQHSMFENALIMAQQYRKMSDAYPDKYILFSINLLQHIGHRRSEMGGDHLHLKIPSTGSVPYSSLVRFMQIILDLP